MSKAAILSFVANPTFRRLVMTALGALVLLLNNKLGLNLNAEEIGGLVLLAVTYVLQSAAVDRARILSAAQAAGDRAAAEVRDLEDAAKVLAKPQ